MSIFAAFLCTILVAFTSRASAQNINEILRSLGGIAQQAGQQAALAQWRQLPPNELSCVEQNLRQQGTGVEAYAAHGIFPDDPRFAPLRANCRGRLEQSTAHPSFSCAQARTSDELAICASPELAELDNAVAAGFQYFKQQNGDASARQINAPLFQARQACGSDQVCIKQRQIEAIIKYHDSGALVSVSRWNLNGSVLILITNGRIRKLFYEVPRPEMIAAGVAPGDLSFEGESTNNQYIGTAYTYNARCGQAAFQASGAILEDSGRVIVNGAAPRFDQNCLVLGSAPISLDFKLILPANAPDVRVNDVSNIPPAPPSRASNTGTNATPSSERPSASPQIAKPVPSLANSARAVPGNDLPQAPPSLPVRWRLLLAVVFAAVVILALEAILRSVARRSDGKIDENSIIIALRRRGWRKSLGLFVVTLAVIAVFAGSDEVAVFVLLTGGWSALFFLGRSELAEVFFLNNKNFEQGALLLNEHRILYDHENEQRVGIRFGKRWQGISAPERFLVLNGNTMLIILTPQRWWIKINDGTSGGNTGEITWHGFNYQEQKTMWTGQEEIVGTTWMHSTKSGDRDYRYKYNPQVHLVQRYGVNVELAAGFLISFGSMKRDQYNKVAVALDALFPKLRGQSQFHQEEQERTSDHSSQNGGHSNSQNGNGRAPLSCYEILDVSESATEEQIKEAYNSLIKKCHPDRVAELDPDFVKLANQKAQDLNAAKAEALSRLRH
jgi:uncharacterized protein